MKNYKKGLFSGAPIIEIDNFPSRRKNEILGYCRDTLLDRFQQKAILVKFIPVNTIIVSKTHKLSK